MTGAAETDRSLGELFGDLARETGTLVRQEVQLAQTEMTEKAASAGKDVALIAMGALLGHAGLLAVILGVIVALGTVIPLWISALLIGAVILAGGYALVRKGMDALKHIDLVPRATVKTLKEDVAWAKREAT